MRKINSKTDSLRKGLQFGYCRLCGSYGLLTRDHVPPQSCGNSGDIIIDGIKYQGGYRARTICQKCNNQLLGRSYDLEFKKIYDEYDKILRLQSIILPFRTWRIECSQEKLLKCFIGHFLAVSLFENNDTIEHALSSEINTKAKIKEDFRRYFLGLGNLDGYDIYYWVYPYQRLVITQCFGKVENLFSPLRSFSIGSLIKMYPLAIYIVDNTKNDYRPYKLPRIDTKLDHIILDFKYNIDEKWPERTPGETGILIGNFEDLKVVELNSTKNISK